MHGIHTIGTVTVTDSALLESVEQLKKHVSNMCKATGLQVVGENHHVFSDPTAITYCWILSQSHLVVHTWPETSSLVIDLFTCTKEEDTERYIAALAAEVNGSVETVKKVSI